MFEMPKGPALVVVVVVAVLPLPGVDGQIVAPTCAGCICD